MGSSQRFDVAVVGGSVAGCATARLLALGGARVALIERRPDPAAYKVTCTHAVLSPATAIFDRMGLTAELLRRGVPRTHLQFWTPYSGWLTSPVLPDGWGVTRRTLDPMLRDLAAQTPGVELLAGWTATRVVEDASRVVGVEVEDRDHRRMRISAPLVVAADGRGSKLAELAGVPGRVRPHNRFFYFAYWQGIRTRDEGDRRSIRLWLLDPDGAAQFANEDDVTVVVATFHRSRLAEVRADVEGAYARAIAALPGGPDLGEARRISKIIGKLEMPNVMRPAAVPGLAFVGDAALATDPFFGVGITFALRSAGWLADETLDVLDDAAALDAALRRYRRKLAIRLGQHHVQIADFSTGRRLRPFERRVLRRAASNPAVASVMATVLARETSPVRLLDPRFAARVTLPDPRPAR